MTTKQKVRNESVEILAEFGPFPNVSSVAGVTHDGERVWFATGTKLQAMDPDTGALTGAIEVASDAGTAFDGRYLYQLAEQRILKIEPESGRVVKSLAAPGKGRDSGLTWAEGTLWVGQYQDRKIHQIDANTGEVLRTLESNRFVTGVSWVDGELWHATWEHEQSELRQVDPGTGEVLQRLDFPKGVNVSGLESDGKDRFFCGGGTSGKVRVVKRKRARE
jgi:glutamine cyclotransferase